MSLRTSFLFVVFLTFLVSCEDTEANAICQCYEDALELEGQALRTEIIGCAKQRDELKAQHKDNPEEMGFIKSEIVECMQPLQSTLAQKSSETKKKVKSNTPNAQKIKKTNKSRGKK